MRIFCAINQSPNNRDLPNSDLWGRNLLPALAELGHEIVRFDYDLHPHFLHLDLDNAEHLAFISQYRPQLETELLRQVHQAHETKPLDLFFSYFYSACAQPATIAQIHAMGIPTVNFYCNAIHQFHLVGDIAPAYDYCMVPEFSALEKYKAIGAHPVYVQMAANPDIYRPYAVARKYDVTFVGQRYGDRAEYVQYLLRHSIEIKVWGPGWRDNPSAISTPKNWPRRARKVFSRQGPNLIYRKFKQLMLHQDPGRQYVPIVLPDEILGPSLSDEEMIKMYSRSRISLGFSGVTFKHEGQARNTHIRLRDFEAPMSGALYFVEYQPELENFYEVGKEIICYDSKQDLVEKARYYLAHEAEAEAVRKAGRERALRDHTWRKRFLQFFMATQLASSANTD